MPTILVADDDRGDRERIGAIIESDPNLTAIYASDGAEALEQIQTVHHLV